MSDRVTTATTTTMTLLSCSSRCNSSSLTSRHPPPKICDAKRNETQYGRTVTGLLAACRASFSADNVTNEEGCVVWLSDSREWMWLDGRKANVVRGNEDNEKTRRWWLRWRWSNASRAAFLPELKTREHVSGGNAETKWALAPWRQLAECWMCMIHYTASWTLYPHGICLSSSVCACMFVRLYDFFILVIRHITVSIK